MAQPAIAASCGCSKLPIPQFRHAVGFGGSLDHLDASCSGPPHHIRSSRFSRQWQERQWALSAFCAYI